MGSRYRAAIIGCGGISSRHARGFQALPGCELVAGADVRPENAMKQAAAFGIPRTYTDYRELLAKEHPDLVAICTWPGTHAEITVAAAEAGARGIICEKPACLSLAEADAMSDACERTGCRLAIAHHHRFDRQNTTARRLIAEGAIGVPTLLRGGPDGGLLNNGTHFIDTSRYLLADPAALWVMGQVERRTDRYERGHPIEDRCFGLIGLEGGARLLVESDMPRDWTGGHFVYGTGGALRFGEHTLEHLNDQSPGWQTIELDDDTDQHRELLAWVEGGPESRQSARIARPTMEIMMAIYESARTRRLVTLPLPAGRSPLHTMIEEGAMPVEVPGKYDIRA
jgi:UDP-N-acetyl-2-amino-2-deoxyglucuronate dehydrogenase